MTKKKKKEDREESSGIHVDENWKAEAKAEKEKLSKETVADKAREQKTDTGKLPKPDFVTLVNSLMMQALMAMGGIEDPSTKKRVVDLDLAKFHIDTLDVLQKKTKGNLEDKEEKMLDQILHELRMHFMGFARQQQNTGKSAGEKQKDK